MIFVLENRLHCHTIKSISCCLSTRSIHNVYVCRKWNHFVWQSIFFVLSWLRYSRRPSVCPPVDITYSVHIDPQCTQNETIQLKMSMKIQQHQKSIAFIFASFYFDSSHHYRQVPSSNGSEPSSTLELAVCSVFVLLVLFFSHALQIYIYKIGMTEILNFTGTTDGRT